MSPLCVFVIVVYEGCPRAFDAGIWWPKTKFGRPAAMNCPKGSVGENFLTAMCGVTFFDSL